MLTGEPPDSAESPEMGKRHLCKAVRIQKVYQKEASKNICGTSANRVNFFTGLTDLPDVLEYIVMHLPACDILPLILQQTSS